ncbi:DUF4974 domain-containing protein [Formosa sediminum]|uniref:DUF4974 domain-containing protein n=1 Tax=Formosa sediminum TaxID=2594004 RepID=A0A516GNQ3_9FLAO|nr:FecR domain-containing protein [Formosa sediminum]QDO93156.1 DUF4974 domain-containing protein [Formosa sediminum]
MKDNGQNKVKILPITHLEKVALKNKILNSVDKVDNRRKHRRLAVGVAFSLICLAGCFIFLYNTPDPSITDIVNTSENVDYSTSNEIVLILGNGENLTVSEGENSFNYSNSGETLIIGEKTKIEQETTTNSKVSYNTLIVPYGKQSKINLSDGTEVWLNSGSKLIYPVAFTGNKREIYLEGEAIFDVAHDKSHPFIVKSKDQEVEVLGTVFGVTSYADENVVNTVLKSGSVNISYHNNPKTHKYADKIKITPGTKATYNKDTQGIVSEKVNVNNYFSWRDGVLIFQNNDLRYVTNRISKYYNIKIEIENEALAKERFSGYLNLNEDLDKVIKNIQASTNMKYKKLDNRIVIN